MSYFHNSDYYATAAYHPANLPDLPDQQSNPNLSKVARSMAERLPWGNAKDVVPTQILGLATPKMLRTTAEDFESPNLLTGKMHEKITFINDPLLLRFLIFMLSGSFYFFIFGPPIILFLYWLDAGRSPTYGYFEYIFHNPGLISYPFLIAASVLITTLLAIKLGERWWTKCARGPEWAFNRRTGMATVWKYPMRRPFQKRKLPRKETHHFCEFDAYVETRLMRWGAVEYFNLYHRYQKLSIPIGKHLLGGIQGVQYPCYATWDFLQSYMDISKPIPDIPIFENFRHLDPVTAEHDRKTGRPRHYWRDMDKKTFRKKLGDMHDRIHKECTANGRCLMAQRIRYAHE